METVPLITLTLLIFAAAALYSSVGHAGASGYLAAMALFGLAPAVMKPTALVLNILVATIASVQFYRAGCFSWRIFRPFALTAVPKAFLGGALTLPGYTYKLIVGLVLLYAAVRMVVPLATRDGRPLTDPPLWLALLLGAGIGLLSGLVGVGGGIFLSPLLILMRWADTRQASGVSAVFILVNSIAGLAGHVSSVASVPADIAWFAAAAVAGGLIGSQYGSRRLGGLAMRRLLSVVLIIAGLKLLVA
jgi:uncharacterized membrane protein YfcA